MTPMSSPEIIECVNWLKNDEGPKAMRDRTESWHATVAMREEVQLPTRLGNGDSRDVQSPRLYEIAYGLIAEQHSYVTSATLISRENQTPQTLNDRIEKWAAMRVTQMLNRWKLLDEGGWHQLVSYGAIAILMPGKPDSEAGSTLELPDPNTCFFPVKGSPIRPSLMGREWESLVRDVSLNHRDVQQGRMPYMKSNGQWDFCPISDDYPRDSMLLQTGKNKYAEKTLFKWLDDGENRYQVAMNRDGQAGQVVYQEKMPYGPNEDGEQCAGAVLFSGMTAPGRAPRERLLGMMLPGIQYVKLQVFYDSVLATLAENNKDDILAQIDDPELVEALARAGWMQGSQTTLEKGNANIIPISGKAMVWPRAQQDELLQLMQQNREDFKNWEASIREISNPDVLAKINTNVYLPHAAARRTLLGRMLDYRDWAVSTLVKMDMYAMQFYGKKDFPLYATGNERYGDGAREIARGSKESINWSDVKDFDKRFILVVSTNSMTETEQRARLQEGMEEVAAGLRTHRQLIPLTSFSDEEAQVQLLAEDEGRKAGAAFYMPQMQAALADYIRTAGGIILQPGGQAPPADAMGGGGGSGTTYNAPVVPGANGSSQAMAGVPA